MVVLMYNISSNMTGFQMKGGTIIMNYGSDGRSFFFCDIDFRSVTVSPLLFLLIGMLHNQKMYFPSCFADKVLSNLL